MVERNVLAGGELIEVAMVGDDRRNGDVQRADPVAVEQVVETVAET
jgi:hypothetical protein